MSKAQYLDDLANRVKRCPGCRSSNPAIANSLGGSLQHYTCRNAWHMPALTTEAQAALEFAQAVDDVVQRDPLLPASVLGWDPTSLTW